MLFISGSGVARVITGRGGPSFNLAIEMLFISGAIPFVLVCADAPSFNLAIEMLFISGSGGVGGTDVLDFIKFQSRNRDAFHFRPGR